MPNLSQKKRQRMLEFLNKIKEEHKNDDEMLIALGEIENELVSKKYGLVWEEHEENVDVQMRTNIPVFTEVKEREIAAAPGDGYNFLLEGDNLHSLYLLEKTHKGRIDVIYIDPPYNTGDKDFIYNDKYINSDDDFLHSKWLSFMDKRLRIAYQILSEDGICFISIDDHEMATLKLLCDDIFGENSFVSTICVETSNGVFGLKAAHVEKTIVKSKDYILVYAKDPTYLKLTPLYSKSKRKFDTHYTFYKDGEYECTLNEWLQSVDLINEKAKLLGLKNNVENLNKLMTMFAEVNSFVLDNAEKIYRVRDYTLNIDDKYLPQLRMHKKILIDGKYVFFGDNGQAYFLYPFSQLVNMTDDYFPERCSSVIIGDLWKGFNDDMGNIGKEGGVKFSNGKKPIRLIKNILKLSSKKNATILDFFAGSATTAEATLDLNKEDGGSRRVILCTNNESNICDEVTYPRVKTVITGTRSDGSKYSEGLPANLKYYRTDFVPRNDEELSERLNEHIVEMIQLEHGVDIDGKEYIMILTDAEMDELEANWNDYPNAKAIYISKSVMMTTRQTKKFEGVEIHIIPDYYFKFELKEMGEAW